MILHFSIHLIVIIIELMERHYQGVRIKATVFILELDCQSFDVGEYKNGSHRF